MYLKKTLKVTVFKNKFSNDEYNNQFYFYYNYISIYLTNYNKLIFQYQCMHYRVHCETQISFEFLKNYMLLQKTIPAVKVSRPRI